MLETRIVIIPLTELDKRFQSLERSLERLNKSEKAKRAPQLLKDNFLTRKETAKRLRISLPTLGDYVKRNIIQAHKIGSRVLFREPDVNKALKTIQTSI